MSKFRYVASRPDRAGEWNKLKTAAHLEDVLTDLQTDSSGRVNYGRAITYAWLLARWPGNPDERPTVRTLKRYMAALKRRGIVAVRVVGFGGGMVVTLLRSAKWQEERPAPAVQLPLLSPRVAQIRKGGPVEKPVGKLLKSAATENVKGTDLSPHGGQICPLKEVKNLPEETIRAVANAHAVPRAWKTDKELDARRRLLLEQAEAIKEKFKSAG